MFKIINHILQGDDKHPVIQLECLKNTKKFKHTDLDTLVIHYTAGSSAESSAHYLCKPDLKASAHLVIGRLGEIYQLVPFDTIAWHAGESAWNGRVGMNRYSIGIELANAGELVKVGDSYRSYFGSVFAEDEVIRAAHKNYPDQEDRYWEKYSDIQIQTLEEVSKLIVSYYSINTIVGHDDIAPTRKTDPGPAFPMSDFRVKMLSFSTSSGLVDADVLNVRSGPGTGFSKIDKPLVRGENVEILEEFGNWIKVEYKHIGWVSKKYIKRI